MAATKKATKKAPAKKASNRRDSDLPASFYEGKKKGYKPPRGSNGIVMPG